MEIRLTVHSAVDTIRVTKQDCITKSSRPFLVCFNWLVLFIFNQYFHNKFFYPLILSVRLFGVVFSKFWQIWIINLYYEKPLHASRAIPISELVATLLRKEYISVNKPLGKARLLLCYCACLYVYINNMVFPRLGDDPVSDCGLTHPQLFMGSIRPQIPQIRHLWP